MSEQKLQEILEYVKFSNIKIGQFETVTDNELRFVLSFIEAPGWEEVFISYNTKLNMDVEDNDNELSFAIEFDFEAFNISESMLTNDEISVLANKMVTIVFDVLTKEVLSTLNDPTQLEGIINE